MARTTKEQTLKDLRDPFSWPNMLLPMVKGDGSYRSAVAFFAVGSNTLYLFEDRNLWSDKVLDVEDGLKLTPEEIVERGWLTD